MSTELKLPYKRFVCQVSNGGTRSKSSYLSMMAENEFALMGCAWRESKADDNTIALPVNNVFLPEGYINDAYDAYIRGGKANTEGTTDTFEGYAGMVAYRFKLPDDYVNGSALLKSFNVMVSRDRFLRAGVRIAAALSNDENPSNNWVVVRGEGSQYASESTTLAPEVSGIRSIGFMDQTDKTYIVDTRAAEETCTITLDGIDTTTKASYLYVYLTLEDYQNRWLWHSNNQRREYWIEGAAMIVGKSNTFIFNSDVIPDSNDRIEPSTQGGISPTFIQPQFLARCEPGEVLKDMPQEGANVSDNSAYFRSPSYIFHDISEMELLGDMSYQVMGANVADGLRTLQEVFAGLVAMSDNVGGISANYAGHGKAIPVGETDRIMLAPKFMRSFDLTEGNETVAQPGLSVWFKVSDETEITDENCFDAEGKVVAVKCVNSPSFIQVSAYAFVATQSGRHITLGAVDAVANTGIALRFAAYKITRSVVMGRLGFYAVPAMMKTQGVARCTTVGTKFSIASEEVGSFEATLCGVSGEVSSAIPKNGSVTIDVDEKIQSGDVIVLIPVPTAVTGGACHFGRQTDPNDTSLADSFDNSWARLPSNLGWFPQVTIH